MRLLLQGDWGCIGEDTVKYSIENDELFEFSDGSKTSLGTIKWVPQKGYFDCGSYRFYSKKDSGLLVLDNINYEKKVNYDPAIYEAKTEKVYTGPVAGENYKQLMKKKKAEKYAVTNNRSSEELSLDDKVLYWDIAKNEVQSRLKSPSTAKFPFAANSDGVTIYKSGDIVTVKSYVDAQNSLGSTLRKTFTVTIKLNGTKYSIQSCIINE